MLRRKNKTKIFIDIGSFSIKVMVESPSNISYYSSSILNDNSGAKNFIKDIKLSSDLSFNNELRAFWKGAVINEENATKVIKYIKQSLLKRYGIKSFEIYASQSSFVKDSDKLVLLKIFENVGFPIATFVNEGIADSLGSCGQIKDGENTILVNLGFSKSSIFLLGGNNIILKSRINSGFHEIVKNLKSSILDKLGLVISYEHAFNLICSHGNLIIPNEINYSIPARDEKSNIKEVNISADLIKEVLRMYADKIVAKIFKIKHQNSIETYQSIMKNGICITGGMSNLSNLDIYIQKTLGIATFKSEVSFNSVISGLYHLFR